MAGFLGAGDLYFNRVINGVSTGWVQVGNATKFEIKEASELKQRKSRQRSTYGQLLDSVAVKQPASLKIAMDDLNFDNLALAFMGSQSVISIGSGTVTDEVNTARKGKIIETVKDNIASVVVKNGAGSVTYIAGTDYEVTNARLGMVKILSTGSITDGATIKISYTYGTSTSNMIEGGTSPTVITSLKLDGINFANQSSVIVDVWEAVVTPTSPVDFLAADFAGLELDGLMNTPTGKNSPYVVHTDVVLG